MQRIAPERPNERAQNLSFEFEALEHASHYRTGIVAEFRAYVRGRVLEVGAGVGHIAQRLVEECAFDSLIATEPEAALAARFRQRLPEVPLLGSTLAELAADTAVDTLVSVNVLEHIRDDAEELGRYQRLLSERAGYLCLCVPARNELYAEMDRVLGHHRRYARAPLRALLVAQGFEVVHLHYFNALGYLGWWLHFRMLRRRAFDARAVRLFDRHVFPWANAFERRVARPPIGQSLIAICRAHGAS